MPNLPYSIDHGRVTQTLVNALVYYRVVWAKNSFANFADRQLAEACAATASRNHGSALIGEYRRAPVTDLADPIASSVHTLAATTEYVDGVSKSVPPAPSLEQAQPKKPRPRKAAGWSGRSSNWDDVRGEND